MSAKQASGNHFIILTVWRSSSSSLDNYILAWQVELVSVEPCQTSFLTEITSSRSVQFSRESFSSPEQITASTDVFEAVMQRLLYTDDCDTEQEGFECLS